LEESESLEETRELLQREQVVIFEAAASFENLFCRIDVLVKDRNELQLIEVKAKSIEGDEMDPFRGAKGVIRSTWKNYLLDVAFQRFVLQQAFPDFRISCWLMCVDKTRKCTVDGLNQLFALNRNGDRTTCTFIGDKDKDTICREILAKRNVDGHLDQLCSEPFGSRDFASHIRWLAENYEYDTKIKPVIGKHCKNCEFQCTPEQRAQGLQDGFRECWSQTLGWTDADFDRPTVFDLYRFSRTEACIKAGRIALVELTEEDIGRIEQAKRGLIPRDMQIVRFNSLRNRVEESYVDSSGLQRAMRDWKYPLHFIDFETAAPSVPLHRGLRPYQSLAFQFSHHTLEKDGDIRHTGEFLNVTRGIFPNFDFLRNLMSSLSGDEGTIFRYAEHENTILNHIVEQLDDFGKQESDYEELRQFACSISKPSKTQPNPWKPGQRQMVDLRDLVASHYYHPKMKGSQSIKYVLPAVLMGSEFLRQKYFEESYGYEVAPLSSRNFRKQAWVQYDGKKIIDPYELLPPVLDEVDKKNWDDLWTSEDIQGGGAAMAAYFRLQQADLPSEYRIRIEKGLLRYCELDTLAMVMIVESWQNQS
jgi:hypothetical protein